MRSVNFITYVPVTDNTALDNLSLNLLRAAFGSIGQNIKWYKRKNVYAVYFRCGTKSNALRAMVKTKKEQIAPRPRTQPVQSAFDKAFEVPVSELQYDLFTPSQESIQ
jgi:hypothetical protein